MIKRMITALFALAMIVLIGCADGQEVDDSAHVLSIGVDRGEHKTYRFTFQMPVLMGAGGEEGGAVRSRSITLEAENLMDALEAANYADARYMSFAHLNFFVVSEELARADALPGLIASGGYLAELRDDAMVIIAQDSARDFLRGFEYETQSNLERIQENLMESAQTSGIIPDTTIADLLEYFTDKRGDCVIAYGGRNRSAVRESETVFSQSALEDSLEEIWREGGLGSDLRGSALFSGGTLALVLTPGETRLLLMGRGEFRQSRYVFNRPDGKGDLVLELTASGAPRVEIEKKDEGYQSSITVYLQARVVDQNEFADLDTSDALEEIRTALEAKLNREMEKMRQRTAATGADAFELTRHLSHRYLSFHDYCKADPKPALSRGELHIRVELALAGQNPYRR